MRFHFVNTKLIVRSVHPHINVENVTTRTHISKSKPNTIHRIRLNTYIKYIPATKNRIRITRINFYTVPAFAWGSHKDTNRAYDSLKNVMWITHRVSPSEYLYEKREMWRMNEDYDGDCI